jgi:HPt (histidine-containing phosphotransfer) domain-containing protein
LLATVERLNQLQEQLQQGADDEQRSALAAELLTMEGALSQQGLLREAAVAGQLGRWLGEARAGWTSNEPAAMHFAQALAWLSLHIERASLDPASAGDHVLCTAEQAAMFLQPAPASETAGARAADSAEQAQDALPSEQAETIPAAFREVFLEESEEIIARLQSELTAWVAAPARDERLREIRRHFHTFKGNGNAVGLFSLGDLGRDVQDLLDRVLESQQPLDATLPLLLQEVLEALPELVATCGGAGEFDAARVRELRNRCMSLGRGIADGR